MSGIFVFNVEGNKSNSFNAPSPPDPNNILCFAGTKSDEEIIDSSEYRPFHSIDFLLDDGKNVAGKIPRPPNPFILYRKDKSPLPQFEGERSSEISKSVAEMWHNEPNNVKEYFAALSRIAEKRHNKKYVNYKYQPKKSKKQAKKQPKKSKKQPKKQPKQQQTPTSSNINSPLTPSSSEFETLSQFIPTPNSNSPITSSFSEFETLSQFIPTPNSNSPLTPSSSEFGTPSQFIPTNPPLTPEFEAPLQFFPTPNSNSPVILGQFFPPLSDISRSSESTPTYLEPSPTESMTTNTPAIQYEQPSQNLQGFMTYAELMKFMAMNQPSLEFDQQLLNPSEIDIMSLTQSGLEQQSSDLSGAFVTQPSSNPDPLELLDWSLFDFPDLDNVDFTTD